MIVLFKHHHLRFVFKHVEIQSQYSRVLGQTSKTAHMVPSRRGLGSAEQGLLPCKSIESPAKGRVDPDYPRGQSLPARHETVATTDCLD